jgi:hypothetical protein
VFAQELGIASACVLMFASAVCACGDVRDVQVPLIPNNPPPATVPELAQARPRALVNLSINGQDPPCPSEFHALLPSASPAQSPSGGQGNRVTDGDGVTVRCLIRARTDLPDVFDVDLLLEHDALPRFTIMGSMSEGRMALATLHIATPDGLPIDANCGAEVLTIRPGALSLSIPSCQARIDGGSVPGCSIEVVATFENCER